MGVRAIYISVSDENGHLIVDGPLDLLDRLLAVVYGAAAKEQYWRYAVSTAYRQADDTDQAEVRR